MLGHGLEKGVTPSRAASGYAKNSLRQDLQPAPCSVALLLAIILLLHMPQDASVQAAAGVFLPHLGALPGLCPSLTGGSWQCYHFCQCPGRACLITLSGRYTPCVSLLNQLLVSVQLVVVEICSNDSAADQSCAC